MKYNYDIDEDLIDKYENICKKIEEHPDKISFETTSYSAIERALLYTANKALKDNSAFSSQKGSCNIQLTSKAEDFLSELANYTGTHVQEYKTSLWLDVLLKVKHDQVFEQLKKDDFSEPNSNTVLFSREKYDHSRLLNYRNQLYPPMELRHIDSANSFNNFYRQEELFPLFIFTQLLTPEFSSNYRLSSDGNEPDKKKNLKFSWVIEALQKRHFFRQAAKERDFKQSLNAIQLMSKCLQNSSYSNDGGDIQPPNYALDLPKDFDLSSLPPRVKGKIIRSTVKPIENELAPNDLMGHAALNLYFFNEATQLLDWFFAARTQSLAVLQLENMMFSKRYFCAFSAIDNVLEKTVIETYVSVFQNLCTVVKQMSNDTLESCYDKAFFNESILTVTAKLIEELETFHYYEGQALQFPDKDTGREDPCTTFYKTMTEYANSKHPKK